MIIMPEAIAKPTVDEIIYYGKTPKELLQMEEFRQKGYTLREEVQAYNDPGTGLRQRVHTDFGKGIWCPEIILTDHPELSKNKLPIYRWVVRPNNIYQIEDGGSKKTNLITGVIEEKGGEKRWEIDGERILYECPASGFAVPATSGKFKGYWRHPETGAAVATLPDRDAAVNLNEAYIRSHENDFAGWGVIENTIALWKSAMQKEEFQRVFGDADLPRKLALIETSYQCSPSPNSGVRAVGRGFWSRGGGPLGADLGGGLGGGNGIVGARLCK